MLKLFSDYHLCSVVVLVQEATTNQTDFSPLPKLLSVHLNLQPTLSTHIGQYLRFWVTLYNWLFGTDNVIFDVFFKTRNRMYCWCRFILNTSCY